VRKLTVVWCRRGDSNPHELPHTPLKRARLPVPPLRLGWEGYLTYETIGIVKPLTGLAPSKKKAAWPVVVCLRRIESLSDIAPAAHFFLVGDGDGFKIVEVGTATGAAVAGVGCVLADAVGVGNGACSGTPDCNTERVPVIIGSDSIKANNMNATAAPIVILDNNVCVPLGPNAVLETELENSAPASAFPGWSRTVTTSTMHARINSP
jgi:hypothetical protein